MSKTTKKLQYYFCPICKSLLQANKDSAGYPVCCGKETIEMSVRNKEGAGEKHLPFVKVDNEKNMATLFVQVGEVKHPMQEDHFIEWVEIRYGNKIQKSFLSPGQEPIAKFEIFNFKGEVTVIEYCNLHGLWETKIEI